LPTLDPSQVPAPPAKGFLFLGFLVWQRFFVGAIACGNHRQARATASSFTPYRARTQIHGDFYLRAHIRVK
jgi:hypothetical protein